MRSLMVLFLFINLTIYGQEFSIGWTKASTESGSEFKKYEPQTACFFIKHRRLYNEDFMWGLGLDMMSFRKSASPERTIKIKGITGEIGYYFRQIPGLTVLGSTSFGLMRCEYDFIDPPADLKGSSGTGVSIEPSVSIFFPLSKTLIFSPSIGYHMLFDKMNFKTTNPIKQPIGKLDSHMFAMTYRLALSWRFRKE
ncbi:MAG TPA: hypothetical protein PLH27_03570 [bacterium]|nr:hypothetical protein [bacterium]HMW34110.1 hypothetical protein [bacterium]HMW35911.1 hypothetical protein [bacterium]HMY35669.1 hypothetical protein [bacterium]HMZ03453.1 hypothetical protein [bacterium]